MTLIQATETTYLGLFLKDGQLQTVRFRQATVVKDSDTGKEIARNEGDEQALPDNSDISGLLGDALNAALASNAGMAQQISDMEEALATSRGELADARKQLASLRAQLAAPAAPAPAAPADESAPQS